MRARAVPITLVALAAVLTPGALTAETWLLLGVHESSLAAFAVTHDPERGFDRWFLVERSFDGAVQGRSPLVSDERYEALRRRGDYEVLRHERAQARQRAMDELLREGYRACEPSGIAPAPRHEPARSGTATAPGGRQLSWRLDTDSGELLLTTRPEGPPIPLGEAPGAQILVDLFWCGPSSRAVAIVEGPPPPEANHRAWQRLLFEPCGGAGSEDR